MFSMHYFMFWVQAASDMFYQKIIQNGKMFTTTMQNRVNPMRKAILYI